LELSYKIIFFFHHPGRRGHKNCFYRRYLPDRPSLSGHQDQWACLYHRKDEGSESYAHINLEKGERSELAELASKIL